MTNLLKLLTVSVACMFVWTAAAFALTPVGESYTLENAPKDAPYWQDFRAEQNDILWPAVMSFLKGSGLAGKYTARVVIDTIELLQEPGVKFGPPDQHGYQTLLKGQVYRFPVPYTEKGVVAEPVLLTQADLQAFIDEQKALTEAQQAAQASLSAQVQGNATSIETMGGKIDLLTTGQNQLLEHSEALTTELASLSKNFGTLAVEDIAGLEERLAVASQQAAEFSELQGTVQALEVAFVSLQNGELTSGMLTAIQSQVDESLKAVQANITELKQADIRFTERLDAVEAEVEMAADALPEQIRTEVETQVSAVQTALDASLADVEKAMTRTSTGAANSAVSDDMWLLWAAVAAIVAALVVLWRRDSASRSAVKEVTKTQTALGTTVASHETKLNDVAKAQKALETEIHDASDGLAVTHEMAATALAQSSALEFQETPDLKFVNEGATSHWMMTDGFQNYRVSFRKRADSLFDCSIARNSDGTGDSEPMAYKSLSKMKTNLQKAHANGRLQNCIVKKAAQAA